MRNLKLLSAALAATLGIAGDLANAGILNGSNRPMDFGASGGPGFIPLNAAGDTFIRFSTTASSTKVLVSFAAECAIAGTGSAAARLDLDIRIDGVSLSPTSTTDD